MLDSLTQASSSDLEFNFLYLMGRIVQQILQILNIIGELIHSTQNLLVGLCLYGHSYVIVRNMFSLLSYHKIRNSETLLLCGPVDVLYYL